jgi:hypothetical protein
VKEKKAGRERKRGENRRGMMEEIEIEKEKQSKKQ